MITYSRVSPPSVVNIGKWQGSCCCLVTSLAEAGLNTGGCPTGWFNLWGYNSIWGDHLWVDNGSSPIYAHLTYWGNPSICDDEDIPLDKFAGTVYKQYNQCGDEELMAAGNRSNNDLNGSPPSATGTVESVIRYLENLITDQPDSDRGNAPSISAALEDGLSTNYPNPFNPVTTISYTLAKDAKVSLKVYNALGQKVKTLVDEQQNAGNKSVSFNAGELPSGVYFYKLQSSNFIDVKKMLIVR